MRALSDEDAEIVRFGVYAAPGTHSPPHFEWSRISSLIDRGLLVVTAEDATCVEYKATALGRTALLCHAALQTWEAT